MVVGFLEFVRSTSSAVLAAASNLGFAGLSPYCSDGEMMKKAALGGAANVFDRCSFCGGRLFAGGEMVECCSESCQSSHANCECKHKSVHTESPYALAGTKVSLLSAVVSSEIHEQSNKILFPYEEFIEFFNWKMPGYRPCGLINDRNSCFANVVLQSLTYTRPLAAYFLEKGHKIECRMDKWCFLCDFQTHVERVSWSHTAFVPINILSRLHSIGSNLERGEQEDAHEFMRFAIDKMQSDFLNEFVGEKAVNPRYQETSFVQHIFGGRLQSQVICSKCNNVSNQIDHMMDLTVEIHGDAESLEECLDQFTAEEWLNGDNMYKCDHCSAYVMARKSLSVQQAPNILTITLKRFQSERFKMLNKRVTFPETFNLRPYMSESEDGNDVYKLYAVIVHVDICNAFGHYICYVKNFSENWYRIDDDKVSIVGLDEVLSQVAYMLLYSRICARPSRWHPAALLRQGENKKVKIQIVDASTTQPVNSADISPARYSQVETDSRVELSLTKSAGEGVEMAPSDARLPTGSDGLYNSQNEDDFPLKLNFFKASTDYQDSGAANKCTFREDGRYVISSFITGEVQNDNSAKRGAMLNPNFSPGSLGRQRWEKFIKQQDTVSQVYGSASSLSDDINDEAAAAAKQVLVSSVGSKVKAKLKPLSVLGKKRRKDFFKQ